MRGRRLLRRRLDAIAARVLSAEEEDDWGTGIPNVSLTPQQWAAVSQEYFRLAALGMDKTDATIKAWELHVAPWEGPKYKALERAWRQAK